MSRNIILVVDDEPLVLHYAARVLSARGYEVVQAQNAKDALKACAELGSKLGLVISDVSMPGMGGMDLAECIAELHPSVPVILMSGYSLESPLLQRFEDSRVKQLRFLRKPFMPAQLEQEVFEAFHHTESAFKLTEDNV